MKKNHTLKIVLAMLIVVLVSLVSFIGVYKGKNLLKSYILGMDFSDSKMATFSLNETTNNTVANNEATTGNNTTSENQVANNVTDNNNTVADNNTTTDSNNIAQDNKQLSEKDKQKQYKTAKNIIEKRLTSMKIDEFNVRLNENTGALAIEIPADVDSNYFNEVVSKAKVQIVNQSSNNDVIVDSNGFKDATVKLDSTTYSNPVILLNIEFTDKAKNIFKNVNTNYTDSQGKEAEATFAFTLDGEALYTDKATSFAENGKNGNLGLVLGQGDSGDKLDSDYKSASTIVALIKNGELPVEYKLNSTRTILKENNTKAIIIISIIVGILMLVFAIFKFKKKAILPVVSLVGLVATILLSLRYTNVKMTIFTILGIAIVTIFNYLMILESLNNDKTFKYNMIKTIKIMIPTLIIAIICSCAPYIQLASFGMSIFWGTIVMIIYNIIITRILIEK